MKKSEFLAQLKKALEQDLDAQKIKEHVEYYDNYIRSEIERGQTEEAVMQQLGDPWAIAKTILLSEKMGGQDYCDGAESKRDSEKSEQTQVKVVSKWKIWLFIAIVIIVLIALLSAAFGLLAIVVRLAIKFAVPIMIVLLVIKLFSKK